MQFSERLHHHFYKDNFSEVESCKSYLRHKSLNSLHKEIYLRIADVIFSYFLSNNSTINTDSL